MSEGTAGAVNYANTFTPQFQQHLLAVLCQCPGVLTSRRTAIKPTFFTSDAHRRIAHGLLDIHDKTGALPTRATLTQAMREAVKDDEAFNAVAKVVKRIYAEDVSDSGAVIPRIVSFGRQHAVAEAVVKAAEAVARGDYTDMMSDIDKAMRTGEDITDIGLRYEQATAEERAAWYEEHADCLSLGATHLDEVCGGGGARGELWAYLGPAKRGKTTALINAGVVNMERGANVVHFSFEMSKKYVAQRYDARVAGPKYYKYRMDDPAKYLRIVEKRSKKRIAGGLVIKAYPTRTCSVSMIRAHLLTLVANGFIPDVVIVDYADIMRPEARMEEYRHQQAGIYEGLRQIAGEFGVLVITASQAKKEAVEKETQSLSDFAEAFEKAAVIDGGIAICQTEEEKRDKVWRYVVIAGRRFQDGVTIELKVRRECCWTRSVQIVDTVEAVNRKKKKKKKQSKRNGADRITKFVGK